MADKTYVHLEKFGVTKIFDSQYKSKVQECMRKLAIKWIEKEKKLTTKGDKKQEGFMLGGTLVKLLKGDKGGKKIIAGEFSLHLSTWPKKSMFGFAKGKAMGDVLNENKIMGDIEALIDAVFEDLVFKQATKKFLARAKAGAKR